MGKCDCFIGILSNNNVFVSTVVDEIIKIEKFQSSAKQYGELVVKGEPLSRHKIADGRRGYLHRFKYCPYCGIEIDWKKILGKL